MNNRLSPQSDTDLRFVQNHSLPELVERQLQRMILEGGLPSGSKLTEIPLADQLGVSRGPIREAFRGLAAKGLVRIEKNCGVFVRTITPEEADDIYEVRIPIETLMVMRLARTPERLASSGLTELLDKAESLAGEGDFAGCHVCNLEFHDRLAVLAGNAALVDVYRRLVSELSLYRHQAHARIADASSLHASVADHRNILKAIADGDGVLASRLVLTHVEASRRRTQGFLASAVLSEPHFKSRSKA